MIFTPCSEPTAERSLHNASPAQLAQVTMWGPEIFTHEIGKWFSVGMQRAANAVTSALAIASVKRMSLNDTEFLPRSKPDTRLQDAQLEVTPNILGWFVGASLALALSRTVGEIRGAYSNLDQVLRIDFDWDRPIQGGIHLSKIALPSLGITPPTRRQEATWHEGTEVFVIATEAMPTRRFLSANQLFRQGDYITLYPVLKREAWVTASANLPEQPNGEKD